MLSVPQSGLLKPALAQPQEEEEGNPSPSPVISVTRPSRVSSSVDDGALLRLRAKYYEQNKDHYSSLSVDAQNNNLSNTAPNSSSKLQRKSSFKAKKLKLLRTMSSGGTDGYESMKTCDDLSSEAPIFSREKIVSVNRALHRNSSVKSMPSPRLSHRPMTLVPARNRIVQFDSSDEDDDDYSISDAASPVSESDLDFGSGIRSKPNQVSISRYSVLAHS